MVIVDTSIWISQFRNAGSAASDRLIVLMDSDSAAICGQVWLEFLSGFKSDRLRREFASDMTVYPWIDTARRAYELATHWRASHPSVGVGDAIIAATAYVNKASVLTLDRDFLLLRTEGLDVEFVGR